ncbi:hypothetical protein JZ751_018621 [Albula glossodonta]|uniref:GB1/RHD3-type G domain-containing protein n=1 Tax=Albula glossodonta TaxID=121402 RepID=A0A8T2MU58_9TELE|nr:hypothetical protein JZ751_018621 [Albula glossodonta]
MSVWGGGGGGAVRSVLQWTCLPCIPVVTGQVCHRACHHVCQRACHCVCHRVCHRACHRICVRLQSTMSRLTVSMPEPVCLIDNDAHGNLRVVPEALDILRRIDQLVVVVGVVGLYRTGKSYLMNKLAGANKGFALGATIQSKTKGIWMWALPHPTKADHTLVLLDTEGLGDVEKGDEKNDNWIFSLAVLLSCTLVYNSKGTIDNDALQRLQYKIITSPECHGKQAMAYNMPRNCLRNYFPTRKCFVFDCPASAEKMKVLDDLTDGDLEPSFVRQTNAFCDYVFKNTEVKTMKGGYRVTGKKSKKACQAIIRRIFKPLEERIESGCYAEAGGYLKYSENLKTFVSQYKAAEGKGIKGEETLNEYLATKESIVNKARMEALEQERKASEEQRKIMEQRILDQERSYKENMEQMLRKMEEDRKNADAEYQRVLNAKLEEQAALFKEGFDKKARLMQDEIDSLNAQKAANQNTGSRGFLSTALDTVGTAAAMFLPGIIPKVAGIGLSLVSRLFK